MNTQIIVSRLYKNQFLLRGSMINKLLEKLQMLGVEMWLKSLKIEIFVESLNRR
jgi:hypothetical protein